jgi:hypothetical protein
MKLVELLKKANKGYPDEYLAEYFDEETGERREGSGDLLARFVAVELRETYDSGSDEETQTTEAIRVLERARARLQGVIDALGAE